MVGNQSAKMYPDKTWMSARKWRRESYDALQRRLKKDFSKTAKEILQGTWDALPKQPADHTVPWWTNVFEHKSDRIDLCLPALREVLWNLVKPITTKEVRHCLTCVRGSQVHLDLTVSLGRRLSNISIQLAKGLSIKDVHK